MFSCNANSFVLLNRKPSWTSSLLCHEDIIIIVSVELEVKGNIYTKRQLVRNKPITELSVCVSLSLLHVIVSSFLRVKWRKARKEFRVNLMKSLDDGISTQSRIVWGLSLFSWRSSLSASWWTKLYTTWRCLTWDARQRWGWELMLVILLSNSQTERKGWQVHCTSSCHVEERLLFPCLSHRVSRDSSWWWKTR